MAKRIKKDPFFDNSSSNYEDFKGFDSPKMLTNSSKSLQKQNVRSSSDLNRKQLKQNNLQMQFEYLKIHAKHPELVEFEDVGATNPFFYNKLKGLKGIVPVPTFWKKKNHKHQRHEEYKNVFFNETIKEKRNAFFEFYKNNKKQDNRRMYPKTTSEFEIPKLLMKQLIDSENCPVFTKNKTKKTSEK